MTESAESGNVDLSSDEEGSGSRDDELAMEAVSALPAASAGNEIIAQNPQTQIVPHSANENEVSQQQQQSEVVITGGNIRGAVFGPQTDKRKIEFKTEDNRNATITHNEVHYHYPPGSEEPSTSGSPPSKKKKAEEPQPDEGYTRISEGIFVSKTPLRKGTRIYKGYQQHAFGDRRELAIKMIAPCEDMHVKEVHNLLTLAYHSNVVQIIHSEGKQGTVQRELYIAMELCGSQNLQDFFNENQKKKVRFNARKAMSFAKQLVNGLKHIHDNKIIHRDLKPENILLSRDGNTIKVSDFGISKRMTSGRSFTRLTAPGQGSEGYKAPETFESDILSQSADIFCLGLILYALFSNGKHAFGQDIHLQNYNIINNKGLDLSGILISGIKMHELLDLLSKTLEHDPKKRPTIEQVSNHLFFINMSTSLIEVAPEEAQSEESAPDQLLEGEDLAQHASEQNVDAAVTVPKTAFEDEANRNDNFPSSSQQDANQESHGTSGVEVNITSHSVHDVTSEEEEVGIIGRTFFAAEEVARRLIHESKYEEAIAVLKDLPPNRRRLMKLAESYLRMGRDDEAENCIETLKTGMTSSYLRPKPNDVIADIENSIDSSVFIPALILIPSASELCKLDSKPDDALWGIVLCTWRCSTAIGEMYKLDGRMRDIALGTGMKIILQLLNDLCSINGADPSMKTDMKARCLNDIGSAYVAIGNHSKSIEFFNKGIEAMETDFGSNASKYSVLNRLFNNLAVAYLKGFTNYTETEKYFLKSLEARKLAEDYPTEDEKIKSIDLARQNLQKVREKMNNAPEE